MTIFATAKILGGMPVEVEEDSYGTRLYWSNDCTRQVSNAVYKRMTKRDWYAVEDAVEESRASG